MKKLIVLLLLVTSLSLYAQLDLKLTLSSRFLDRGFDVFAENNPALQPEFQFSFGKSGFSLIIFASFPLQNYSQLSALNEIDLTLNYTAKLKNLYISFGLTNYGWYFSKPFSLKTATSQEVYWGTELLLSFLVPRLFFYYDFGQGDGLYIEAGIYRTIKLGKSFDFNLDLWQGYNNGQWGVKKGLADFNLKAEVEIGSGRIKIVPFFWYCRIFNRQINPQDSELILGVTLYLTNRK